MLRRVGCAAVARPAQAVRWLYLRSASKLPQWLQWAASPVRFESDSSR